MEVSEGGTLPKEFLDAVRELAMSDLSQAQVMAVIRISVGVHQLMDRFDSGEELVAKVSGLVHSICSGREISIGPHGVVR